MLAFAPLNTGAKALEDSFYSEEQVEESTGISDFLEKDSDDFTSGDEEITDSFSSQIEEQVESNNDESNNDWTPLDNESKISFKYDSETKVLSFKASEPAALPDNTQDGSTSNWYLKNAEVANAVTIEIGDNITKIGENNFDNHLNAYPNIKNVILASSVKEIGYAAFYKVSSLQLSLIHIYHVDRILARERCASRKAGGTGICYTVMVNGKESHLYYEFDKWFMERRCS